MAPKRSNRAITAKSNAASAKRTKTVDPVTEKVQLLVDAFNDANQVLLVTSDMHDHSIDMLRASICTALGVGSAKDERHEYQTKVADFIGEVLQKVVTTWEEKVEEAVSSYAKISEEKAAKTSAIEAAQAVREEKCSMVKERMESLTEAKRGVSAAKEALAGAQVEFDEADAQRVKKEEEKGNVSSLFGKFEVLKAGEIENSTTQQAEEAVVGPLIALLKDIKVDASLISAVPSALGKKSDERGTFDNMVVNNVGDHIRKHLTELDDFLKNFDEIKQKRETAIADAKNSLEKAETHVCSCQEAVDAAMSEEIQAESALKDAKKAVKLEEKKLTEAETEEEVNKTFLSMAKSNMEIFTFLYERTQLDQKLPEATAESEPLDSKLSEAAADPEPLREPALAGA